MLAALCEGMEAQAVQGSPEFDCEKFGILCDRLGRLLGRLGIARTATDVTEDLDLTLERVTARRKER